jgi:hypothetical protein
LAEAPGAQRERLFDLYSRHFSLWQPEYQDIFPCPLCQQGFNRLALEGDNPAVNLAYVIPDRLGGGRSARSPARRASAGAGLTWRPPWRT